MPGPENDLQGLICFSHLRWNFVYQRPQHLMSRASNHWPVYFWEEPVEDDTEGLQMKQVGPAIFVLCPHIAPSRMPEERIRLQGEWLAAWVQKNGLTNYAVWYYTPMMRQFSDILRPAIAIYDCMDELSGFLGAHTDLGALEGSLMQHVDLLFTGGPGLFEHKRHFHPNAYLFPSAIDFNHFSQARKELQEPADQAAVDGVKIGFCGVIDERFDTALVKQLAASQPGWQFIFLGPVVKIAPESLPTGPNLHYLGMKAYAELPAYLAHWQVAMLPFALNKATRFISPTKTPEYLAAGLPVVSTPITDVKTVYEKWACVFIGADAEAFERAIMSVLSTKAFACQKDLDNWLKSNSWEATWKRMYALIQSQLIEAPVYRQEIR
ncbi:hypothetical protein BLX24_27215 [Arsenicibacter rosenii]|uniref:Glycosyl transferase n=1 Tax=Arsenicibacter rosenii TaxID=1750698 RepID=A0A1S2VCL9_9BACT|nr:hypothetical protein BLX24_27215 [Arsenicibacter rosenii]